MITENMKLPLSFFFCFFVMVFCNAQPCECLSKNAVSHYEKYCKVTGYVAEVYCRSNALGNVIFLNLGSKYPAQDLSIIIRGKYFVNFPGPPDLLYKNKRISVYGIIKSIKGKPVIYIKKEADIEILE
jgi:hypothetical protein